MYTHTCWSVSQLLAVDKQMDKYWGCVCWRPSEVQWGFQFHGLFDFRSDQHVQKRNCFAKRLENNDYSAFHSGVHLCFFTFEHVAPFVCISMTIPEGYLETNSQSSCRYPQINAWVCVRSRLRYAPRSFINALYNTPDLSPILLW